MVAPLIEWVFSNTTNLDPKREPEWMEWYDYHQLMICRLPGWSWVYRYIGLLGPDKYLSLYRIETYDALKHIEGWPRVDLRQWNPVKGKIHPAALEDWYEKERRGLADTGRFTFTGGASKHNPHDQGHWGWRQLAGSPLDNPFLSTNKCIGTELVSVSRRNDDKWIAWYKNHRFPALMKLPRVVDAGLFGITTEGHEHEPAYSYITIFELETEDTAYFLGDPTRMESDARVFWEDPNAKPYYDLTLDARVNYYKPISKHWSFEK